MRGFEKSSISRQSLLLLSFAWCFWCIATPGAWAFSTSNNHQSRVALKGLDEATFRHPLDRDLTSLIQAAPFVSSQTAGKNGLASQAIRRVLAVAEEGLRLDLLSSCVKVSSQQLPELHQFLVEACDILDFPSDSTATPELYIQSSSVANAYTLALRQESSAPIVVVTSALVDRCSLPELQAILGHELGHLKCEHSLYLTLGGLASTPLRNLPLIGPSTQQLLEKWRLAAEYSCDRAALLVAQDVQVVNSAMLKLFAGTSKYVMNTEAFVAQCLEYDQLLQSANPLVRASIQRQQRTHPLPVRRVAELERWATSKDYASILHKGVPLVRTSSSSKEKTAAASNEKQEQ